MCQWAFLSKWGNFYWNWQNKWLDNTQPACQSCYVSRRFLSAARSTPSIHQFATSLVFTPKHLSTFLFKRFICRRQPNIYGGPRPCVKTSYTSMVLKQKGAQSVVSFPKCFSLYYLFLKMWLSACVQKLLLHLSHMQKNGIKKVPYVRSCPPPPPAVIRPKVSTESPRQQVVKQPPH